MLRVQRINVFREDSQALWDVSIEARQGEILVLIGSNGAGKTTLLEAIMGSLRPTTGTIEFLGQRIGGLKTNDVVERGLSYTPEGRRLFGAMTVLENLEMGAFVERARRRLKDTLEWVFGIFPILKERLNQKAETLSGGEQQMLAIGRALMSRPQLLMLDEPSLGLGPIVVERVFEVIRQINQSGVSIVLAEQNAMEALEIADRAYVLEIGRIAAEGTREEMLRDEHIRKAYLGM